MEMNPVYLNIYTSILIAIICLMGASLRIWRAKKSGLFYVATRIASRRSPKGGMTYSAAKDEYIHFKLRKYYDNIHFISSPVNYIQQFLFFVMCITIGWNIITEFTLWNIFFMGSGSLLIALGQSTLASYHWQIWINRGSGLPDIDPEENHMSEFAIGKKSFWFSSGKIFNGTRSWMLILVGSIEIISGIYLLLWA